MILPGAWLLFAGAWGAPVPPAVLPIACPLIAQQLLMAGDYIYSGGRVYVGPDQRMAVSIAARPLTFASAESATGWVQTNRVRAAQQAGVEAALSGGALAKWAERRIDGMERYRDRVLSAAQKRGLSALEWAAVEEELAYCDAELVRIVVFI